MDTENMQVGTTNGSRGQTKAVNMRPVENSVKPSPSRSRSGPAKATVSPAVMIEVIQQALQNGRDAGIVMAQWNSATLDGPVLMVGLYGYHICKACGAFCKDDHEHLDPDR